MRHLLALLPPLALAACAHAPDLAAEYRCDGGRGFLLQKADAQRVVMTLDGMRFGLLAEPSQGAGERFSCSTITLQRNGEVVRADVEGVGAFENCRPAK